MTPRRPGGSSPRFEEVSHTADWALRVRGATLAELFAHAAEGMYSLVGGRVAEGAPRITREVSLAAPDVESLLVAWLNELLYLTESEAYMFDTFEMRDLGGAIRIDLPSPQSGIFDGKSGGNRLVARVTGGRAAGLKKQIKATTFHNLRIATTKDGLETTIVFDV